jgi:HxlR-like helix-turn-helix
VVGARDHPLSEGEKRFSELSRSIDGISQRMLTRTLRGLERRPTARPARRRKGYVGVTG